MKYLNKIIEYGLYLLVFLLPIQTRWIIKAGETEYSTYSLYGTDILLLVILALFFILKFSIFNFQFSNNFQLINFQTKRKIQNTKYKIQIWWFVLGLILVSVVSIFFGLDKILALYKFGWLILGIGLFWLIVSASYNRLKLIYVFLAGVFLQAILGIWQFLTQTSFANKWLGIALHNPSDLGVSVVETISERWLRAYGGLDYPNMLGCVIVIGILLLIGQIIVMKQGSNFQFSIFNFKIIFNARIFKIMLWLLLLIFVTALFFSFSRTAWLGLVVGLVVIIILVKITKNLVLQKQLAKIVLAMGVLIFLLFSQCQNLVIARVSGEGRLESKSIAERTNLYQECWHLIKNNWLVGVGIGNYTLTTRNKIFVNQASYSYQPVHNTFFLIWSEIGIFGLIFFVGLFFYILISNFQIIFKNKLEIYNYNKLFNLSILGSLIIFLSFDHWWWSLHFGVLFFWLIIGLIVDNLYIKKVIN
ncbi:MAG: O-antigen ligase family protein [bacterium]|nr:O-antigen ligase family protein [bacterium]